MTRHYPDLGSISDWLNQISQVARPIRSTTQILVVMHHRYGIFALVSQTSFGGETQGCRNASATGAIAAFFVVFAGCKLLEKSEKWTSKKQLLSRKYVQCRI